MKKINWVMPFQTMDYLSSLTAVLAENPLIVLITALHTEQDVIEECCITLREVEDMDNVLLELGASIGAHAVSYSLHNFDVEKEECVCDKMIEESEEVNLVNKNYQEEVKEFVNPETVQFIGTILERFKK